MKATSPSPLGDMPTWIKTAPADTFCVCGKTMRDHKCDSSGALVVKDGRGRLTCAGFYSHEDMQRARRLRRAELAAEQAEAKQRSAARKAAKKAATKRRSTKRKPSALEL